MNGTSPQSVTKYERSVADEFDWKLLDQLHNAVTRVSGYCFEFKKACVTIEVAAMTLLTQLARGSLDHATFAIGCLIPIMFWAVDANTYFYQVRIRQQMRKIQLRIANRQNPPLQDFLPALDDERAVLPTWPLAVEAARHPSMMIYWGMLGLASSFWFWAWWTGRL